MVSETASLLVARGGGMSEGGSICSRAPPLVTANRFCFRGCSCSVTRTPKSLGFRDPALPMGLALMLVCGMLSRSASSDAKSTDSISFVSSASFSEGLGAGLGDGGGEAISSGEFVVVAVRSRDFGTQHN